MIKSYFLSGLLISLFYRILLGVNSIGHSYSSEMLVRKLGSGFTYDIVYLCASALNPGNLFAINYVHDGIASWSMIMALYIWGARKPQKRKWGNFGLSIVKQYALALDKILQVTRSFLWRISDTK